MANLITLSRFPLLLILILMLYYGNTTGRLLCVLLFIFVFLLDTVDGIVARKRGEASLLGSMLDIASDRVLEFTLWIVLSDLNLVSIAIPLIVITRGVLVDAVRSVGASRGQAPFGQVNSRIGKILVASPFMRTGYSVSKGFAFGLLILTWGLYEIPRYTGTASTIHLVAQIISWIAVAFCLVRGLPVLSEARSLLTDSPDESGSI